MSLWGKNNNANSAPKFVTTSSSGNTGIEDYGNTVIFVNGDEGYPVPRGWARKVTGTGGRSGKIKWESLVVFADNVVTGLTWDNGTSINVPIVWDTDSGTNSITWDN